MSKGIYTILQRMNSREDALLTATQFLNDRLNTIYLAKKKQGVKNPLPSISDIVKTHMMYMVSAYHPHVAVAYEYFKVSKEGGGMSSLYYGSGGNKLRFCLKGNNGDFLHDQVLHLKFQDLGDVNAANTATHFQWCKYPGVRMCKRVVLKIDNVEIDDYVPNDILLQRKIDIDTDKVDSWDVNNGQEVLRTGEYYNTDLQTRQVMIFKDGAQTPRTFQPGLELWIPLRFWYNQDVGQSLQNSLIKTDDKYLEFELEDVTKLVTAYDGDLNPLPDYFKNNRVAINTVELYSRNIYINQELHDLMVHKKAVSIIRVNRRQTQQLNTATGSVLFSQMKYPIEHFSFGFKPLPNEADNQRWDRFGNITTKSFPIPAIINNAAIVPFQQLVVRTATYDVVTPVVDQLGLVVYGNVVYPNINQGFYNTYLGFVTPDSSMGTEPGIYMLNMSQYRSKFINTGYVNNSEAREVYLTYIGQNITPSAPVSFHCLARCINFLIYEKGSIKLKYIT